MRRGGGMGVNSVMGVFVSNLISMKTRVLKSWNLNFDYAE